MSERAALDPPRPLADLGSAFALLTVLPTGGIAARSGSTRAAGWYPWVGWVLAAAVVLPLVGAMRLLGHTPVKGAMLAGALVVAAWAALTRLLHWDGLADTFDGLLGGHTRERRLEIMRDSAIGAFGAAAIAIVAIVQVAAIADFASEGRWWPLVVAPVLGRLSAALGAWMLPAARADGLGAGAVARPGVYGVLVATVPVVALVALTLAHVPVTALAVTAGVGVAAAFVVPRVLARGVGGITGDLLGASILLVETLLLVVGAILI